MKSSKEENDNEELPRMSACLLQRKFKINYSMAKQICDLVKMAHLEDGWFDVKEKPPSEYGIEMLVFGKPINLLENCFGYFIAFHNPCSGWVKKDDHTCLLYVTHYQLLKIPQEEKSLTELPELVVGRRHPLKEI